MDYDRLFVDQSVKNSINSNENRVSAKSSDWIVVEVYVSVNAHEEMKTIVLNMAVTVHFYSHNKDNVD